MSAVVLPSQPSIVERLRYLARLDHDEENFGSIPPPLLTEAADRIKELEAALRESRPLIESFRYQSGRYMDLLKRIDAALQSEKTT